MLRPPSNPPPSAPLRGQRTDGGRRPGRRPRTPGPVRSWRSGRTVVVAARVARADQTALDPAEALRLPNTGKLANEVESGLGEQKGVVSFAPK